jgi:1-acyl-sn-glycerol-3-phosphate acyltransferase
MAALRSALFALLFYLGTLVYLLTVFVMSPFSTRAVRAVVRGWSNYHHFLVSRVLGIRMVFEGTIPPGPYLIAIKHQAMVETIEALRLADAPVVVMKRELTMLPLFGWVARRYGVIGVDREAGAKALREMLAAGKAAVAAGRPVVIFPEGTRTPVGEQPELRAGFAGLYRALGLPVVPVAVDSGKVWPRGFVKRPGAIRFKVGEVIEAGLKRGEVEARVHSAINALEASPA